MIQFKSGRLAIFIIMCMVFVKIYQHNLIIRLNYERQRLEIKKKQLKTQKNDFQRQLCCVRDSGIVSAFAQDKLGLSKTKFSQVMTFTGL